MDKLHRIIEWTKLKIRIEKNVETNFYFHEREIWWASLGSNIGFEQDGKNNNFERPVIVIKKFNRNTLCILPLTSKEKNGKYYFQFEYKGEKYSVILCQLRTISSKRLLRKLRLMPIDEFKAIIEKLKNIL